ncbi:lipid-binding protein [Robertkochia solimangrovi]|uniref:lipid-binding protein n=1 Tax=Robertkochia solimangrovi TaxID=2213046 RepID=UPI0011800442|nr:lipid-binding protein [Robertkochia solimangrovi]TRZ44241.1 hypothetical protein DMZ48_06930 [Robertkochia solimangrovi]
MKKIYKIAVLLFTGLAISGLTLSCDEHGDEDPGATRTVEFAGDWFIVGYFSDGTVAYNGDYVLYSTYNASSNDENFWIDDHNTFFQIKTKVQAEFGDLTFSGQSASEELYTGGTVTVTNGRIIKNGGRAYGSNTVVDSIYFEAEFDWDPGTTYIFGGHKRTGFLEDDSPTIE